MLVMVNVRVKGVNTWGPVMMMPLMVVPWQATGLQPTGGTSRTSPVPVGVGLLGVLELSLQLAKPASSSARPSRTAPLRSITGQLPPGARACDVRCPPGRGRLHESTPDRYRGQQGRRAAEGAPGAAGV